MRQRVVFIDVDDTLIRSVGIKRIPMPSVIQQIKQLHAAGAILYLWSQAGADYAQSSAMELGIQELFFGFPPKPEAYIDDQPVHESRFCKHVLPANAADA
jgi:predicted HAD superfamily phosphohydrolase YqeG